jgi:pantoate--beta-alanine ligase
VEVIDSATGLAALVREARRAGRRVGLVPTMGALHAGHLAHLRTLRPCVDLLVVSVFVNPTQFGPGEDWERYPRDLPADVALATDEGADVVFAPPAAALYPEPPAVFVAVEGLGQVLEGASRPTHFRGVTTVVAKLLNLAAADVVSFGQKDAQQVVVVRRMVRELLYPVEIVVVPTVREADGLALSSRNRYLTAAERAAAPVLYRALQAAAARVAAGERDPAVVAATLHAEVAREPLARLDYAAVADAATLAAPPRLDGRILLLLAARFGAARLIDNLCLDIRGDTVEPALP